MRTSPPEFENTLGTLSDIERALGEARALAVAGDTAGAQNRIRQVKLSLLANVDMRSTFEGLDVAQNLLVGTLADLVTLLEERGAYFDALVYARELRQQAPAYEVDVRRLSRKYVLNGSRAPHVAVLQNRVRAAERSDGSLVLIEGAVGIGKSTLARTCADWARQRGAVTVTGRCYAQGVAPPMTPWLEAFQLLSEANGMDLVHLPAPFGTEPPAESVESLIQRIAMHLRDQAAKGAVVILLDDLHWADQESLDLLEYVTRHVERIPLLILGTYRIDEVAQIHALEPLLPTLLRDRPTDLIRLTKFTRDDTVRFIESHLGPCRNDLVNYLHERAEGNPLFLVELLNDLVEQNLLRQSANGHWTPPDRRVPIPPLLHQMILQRVTRLGQRSKTLLDVAAVMGEVWVLSVVEQVLDWPEEELWAEMERLLAARLIEQEDDRGERYRFSHGLIREVLYERQIPRRRRHLHAQIADQLKSMVSMRPNAMLPWRGNIVGELAYHNFRAERWLEAFHYSREAGTEAYRLNALHSVVHYHRQALRAEEQCVDVIAPELLLSLFEQLGDAHLLLSQKDEALSTYQRMLEVASGAEDKARVAHALFRLAEAQERTYDHEQSERTLRTALPLVADVDAPQLMMRYHFAVGHHHLVSGGIDRASYHLQHMEEYAQIEKDERALLDARRYQAYLAIFQGQYRQALELTKGVLTRARAMSNVPLLLVAYWLRGLSLTELGDYELAREALLAGLELRETVGERHFYVARIRNTLGYLHHELGDLETAMHWNRESLEINAQGATHLAVECACYSLLDLAAHCLDAGQLEASAAYLREFDTISDDNSYASYRSFNRAKLLQAELAIAQGEYATALEHALRAVEMAERETMRKNITKGLLLQGRALLGMGNHEQAFLCLGEAVKLADQIEHTALRWQARLRLADAYDMAGSPPGSLYQEAFAFVEQIGQNLHDSHLRNSFLAMPLVVELKEKTENALASAAILSAESPRPAGLSRREIEVLRLVAAGLTDRQIGEQLHISERTVNAHVVNILNKTNSQNRAAASAFAAQHGLVDPAG